MREAINEKLNALRKNNTPEVTDLPEERSIVGRKWIFTVKCKTAGGGGAGRGEAEGGGREQFRNLKSGFALKVSPEKKGLIFP